MAQLTSVTPPVYNVIGKLRQQLYSFTGVNGDTFVVGLNTIKKISFDRSTVLSMTAAPGPGQGQNTITIASSGAYTTITTEVLGN